MSLESLSWHSRRGSFAWRPRLPCLTPLRVDTGDAELRVGLDGPALRELAIGILPTFSATRSLCSLTKLELQRFALTFPRQHAPAFRALSVQRAGDPLGMTLLHSTEQFTQLTRLERLALDLPLEDTLWEDAPLHGVWLQGLTKLDLRICYEQGRYDDIKEALAILNLTQSLEELNISDLASSCMALGRWARELQGVPMESVHQIYVELEVVEEDEEGDAEFWQGRIDAEVQCEARESTAAMGRLALEAARHAGWG